MVSRDRRDPIVLQKVRKQGMILARVNTRFWQEIIYKSLIPTFGKHTIMMTNKPKVGSKLL